MSTKMIQKICCCIKLTSQRNASNGINGVIESRPSVVFRRRTIADSSGFYGRKMTQNQIKKMSTAEQQRWAITVAQKPTTTTVSRMEA